MTAPVRQSAWRAQWLAQLGELAQQIGMLAGLLGPRQLDWSPPEGGWGIKLGDGFAITIVHEQRHLGQLERIRAHAAFPTSH